MSMRKRLNPILSCLVLTASVSGLSFTSLANAAGGGNNECPVGLVSGQTLDDEFGSGTSDLTKCLDRRHNV